MISSLVRRLLRMPALLATCATALAMAPAAAQSWEPSRKVELIVPSGPGAALDTAAREMFNQLEKRKLVTQPLVVSNKSGGAGAVALQTLEQHAGDGHWLSIFTSGMLNARAIGSVTTTYEGMTPLVVMLEEAVVVAVRADSPIRNATDLVARLKTDPGALSIGVATAIGNHIHAGIAKPLMVGGVDISRLRVVPFKSSAESMTALLGGHLDVVAASTPNVITNMQAGRIRVIAVATSERLKGALASVPTWTEQGVPAVYASVQGVLGPKGMPAEQVRFWEQSFKQVIESSEWQAFVAKQNWRPVYMGSSDMAKYMETEYAATKKLITELKLDTQPK
ncbi:tripartite tricarboxylate transporter substrate binding protein [Hydrogenophaga sp. BPS33]|uniref:tripartite tricarboxylate transporter substrate binding protein n=1 Tax=Hydrogenophaga sp. BPS33 TaxID=2651974 RepID=UPI00131FC972|nr:tripartite tricarboxylate transporter substrate binding protein [Hydrogenophaga sp. BPS33]QHE85767.1 tripartite tricarboxylate transporter substrate binding protein [Hydrogenophaga sp. BPS33]